MALLSSSPSPCLPLREIPGSYGLPFFGAIKDRWDYFYIQGKHHFFKSRVEKHNSTVFRVNMPPGHFISSDPRVVVLLDANSFPVLFDNSKVEKRDVLDGTYMPSLSFTGGRRMCAYLDPSESKHKALKSFFLSYLASKQHELIPLFRASLADTFVELDDHFKDVGRAEFGPFNEALAFEFVFRLLCDGKSPLHTQLKSKGPSMMLKWLACQIAPLATLGLSKWLNPLEDFVIHTFRLPFVFVKNDYKMLYDTFYSSATSFLDRAESFGISREEACHNLVFLAGFNALGGFKAWFPTLFMSVASAGQSLHRELADEIRSIVKSEGGVTSDAIDKMVLTKSVVYEALRLNPPVPFQYAKAKKDIVVHSHENAFCIKKGEMIFGYQPFATRDPKIFHDPEEFVGNRFVGQEGEKLLKYVLWSNGRETDCPTVDNKQCPAKDLVVLLSRVLLAEFFLRYDTFCVESRTALSVSVAFSSLMKATSS